jgi:hypothetical protein
LNHALVAQISLFFLCTIQGLATLAIDFNRTHATNPAWTGHARFHVVWQTVSVALLSVLEIVLVWMRGPGQRDNFLLGAAPHRSITFRIHDCLPGPENVRRRTIGSQWHPACPDELVRGCSFHRPEFRSGPRSSVVARSDPCNLLTWGFIRRIPLSPLSALALLSAQLQTNDIVKTGL